jgi:FlaA1/EpsC-like NDP-sugar epimerase
VDIEITTMGMRKGEKRHEELTYPHEALEPTAVEGINRVKNHAPIGDLLDKQVSALIEAARRHDVSESLRLLSLLVEEYDAGHQVSPQRLPA